MVGRAASGGGFGNEIHLRLPEAGIVPVAVEKGVVIALFDEGCRCDG